MTDLPHDPPGDEDPPARDPPGIDEAQPPDPNHSPLDPESDAPAPGEPATGPER